MEEQQCKGAAPARVQAQLGVSRQSHTHPIPPSSAGPEGRRGWPKPSPQAVFHWHPAHPNTVMASWVLDISSCSSVEPDSKWAAMGSLIGGKSAEVGMSKGP